MWTVGTPDPCVIQRSPIYFFYFSFVICSNIPALEFINNCSKTEIHPHGIALLRITNLGRGKALRGPPDSPQHRGPQETKIREAETLA